MKHNIEKLIFATSNPHKIKEVHELLSIPVEIAPEHVMATMPPETGSTFEQNAFIKAMHVYNQTGVACFAEDSGLCVEALEGEPGIYSARYAGPLAGNEQNIERLLQKLEGVENRKAFFYAALCYVDPMGSAHYFAGKVEGEIAHKTHGNTGFGYDPVFIPQGYTRSFAQLGKEIKNSMSHRKEAVLAFNQYLQQL